MNPMYGSEEKVDELNRRPGIGSFLTETLLGKIIPVVTEKHEFDYRDKSIMLCVFRLLC